MYQFLILLVVNIRGKQKSPWIIYIKAINLPCLQRHFIISWVIWGDFLLHSNLKSIMVPLNFLNLIVITNLLSTCPQTDSKVFYSETPIKIAPICYSYIFDTTVFHRALGKINQKNKMVPFHKTWFLTKIHWYKCQFKMDGKTSSQIQGLAGFYSFPFWNSP